MSETSETLFTKLYNGAEELVKVMSKPLAERSLRRKFQSAYDDAQNQIDQAEESKLKAYTDLKDFDLNSVLQKVAKADAAKRAQSVLKAEYLALFGEEFKV